MNLLESVLVEQFGDVYFLLILSSVLLPGSPANVVEQLCVRIALKARRAWIPGIWKKGGKFKKCRDRKFLDLTYWHVGPRCLNRGY